MDMENLGPAPDLDAVNFDTLDRGDTLPGAETPPAEPEAKAPETPEAEVPAPEAKEGETPETEAKEAEAKEGETQEPEAKEGEQPRDASGKFAKKSDNPSIPKARFDEAVNKEREARIAAEQRAAEAERRYAEAQRNQQREAEVATTITDLDAKAAELLSQHSKLLLDGDHEKASEVMLEVRKLDRQIARLEAETTSAQTTSTTLDNQRLGVVITGLERDHEVLNPKSEKYDDDLVQTILLWQEKGVNSGLPPSVAMENAAAKVLERFYKTNAPEAEATDAQKEGLSEVSKEAEQRKDDRQRQAVKKGLETQEAQPPAANTLGVDSDKLGEKGLPDVSRMSADEFDALPETTKARLRGDMV